MDKDAVKEAIRSQPQRFQEFYSTDDGAKNILLTTAPSLEGFRIVKTIEIVTSECVYGLNLFRDLFAGITDLLGGRSNATQNALRDARKMCLVELKKEAFQVGANAVIAVDLDYSKISGGGKSMLFLVASGTAVLVEPVILPMPPEEQQTPA
jgi:uncharacterized protein YbjQ (UPF0145 family)